MATIDKKKDIEEEMMAISIKAIAKASFGDFFNNEQEINAYYHNHMTVSISGRPIILIINSRIRTTGLVLWTQLCITLKLFHVSSDRINL